MAKSYGTLKKLADGDHAVLDDQGKQVILIRHKDLMDHADESRQALSAVVLSAASGETLPVDREVVRRTQQVMSETGLSYGRALNRLMASDRDLAQRYRAAHSSELSPGDPSPGSKGK